MHQLFCAPGCCWRFLTRSAWQHAVELHQTLRAPVGAAAKLGYPHLRRITDVVETSGHQHFSRAFSFGTKMACVTGHGVPCRPIHLTGAQAAAPA